MTHFSISIDVDAAPDRVWQVMRDVQRWSEWTSSVTSIEALDGGELAVGKRYCIRQPKFPPAYWSVSNLDDAGRSFVWISDGPGILVTARHSVEARDTGARATLSIQYDGLLGRFLAFATKDINHRYLKMEANGLKQRSEQMQL